MGTCRGHWGHREWDFRDMEGMLGTWRQGFGGRGGDVVVVVETGIWGTCRGTLGSWRWGFGVRGGGHWGRGDGDLGDTEMGICGTPRGHQGHGDRNLGDVEGTWW